MDFCLNFFTNFSPLNIYLLFFILLVLSGSGLPISEDIIIFAGAYSAYIGLTSSFILIFLGIFGVLSGDSFIYFMGRKYGLKILNIAFFRKIFSEQKILKASQLFEKKGLKLIFFARFLIGLRVPIFFSSGTLGTKFYKFILYDGLASLISVPGIIFLVYYNGKYIDKIFKLVRSFEYAILVLFILVLIFLYFKKRKKGA